MRPIGLVLLAAAALGGCAPAAVWVPPPDTAGRQINQDMALCHSLGNPDAGLMMGGVIGGLVAVQAEHDFDACIQRAGYHKAPAN